MRLFGKALYIAGISTFLSVLLLVILKILPPVVSKNSEFSTLSLDFAPLIIGLVGLVLYIVGGYLEKREKEAYRSVGGWGICFSVAIVFIFSSTIFVNRADPLRELGLAFGLFFGLPALGISALLMWLGKQGDKV